MPSEQNQPKPRTVPAGIQPYLMEIAERLFSGHAALMVGSGFSKNAKPTHPSARKFPDWSELGDKFYEKLHGNKPSASSNYLNVLRLAEEVEAAFGRPALDQILGNAIPDSLHEPSPLHNRLLSLPWSDVFTTNYDTLLDRATSSVSFQKYDLVVNKEDLVYSERPRIIKLHGSFPSKRPFIITEDDYRRYPIEFAPFVNTVRQSLLENTLCLIGFSGDDPNFLQWIGWIRDNLGYGKGPKIYLIGLLQLSSSLLKLLEHRDIVPVDLATFSNMEGKYEAALEKFLGYLESYRDAQSVNQWQSRFIHLVPDDRTKQSNLLDVLKTWKNDRHKYPGWIIPPHNRRLNLWNSLEPWLNSTSQNTNLSFFADLEFAFELLWRLEKCLCPIFDEQVDFFEEIAKRYLSIIDTIDSPEFIEERQEMNRRKLNRQEIYDMCVHILISVMRYYRGENSSEKWTEISSLVANNLTNLDPNDRARFSYEIMLKSLFDLDIPKLIEQVSNWSIDESLPFWRTKKAGLLAEIGRLDEAAKILEDSLATVRHMLNLKPIEFDYTLVSQESYIMFHLRAVKIAQNRISWEDVQKPPDQDSKRWNVLRQYECDPWNELRLFGSTLDRPYKENERKDFDLGSATKMPYPFGHPNERTRMAYSFLIFCEEIGTAFRIPGCDIAPKTAESALKYITRMNSYWAIVTLIRTAKDNVVDSVFDRLALSKMTRNYVDHLAAHLLRAVRNSEKIDKDSRVGLTAHTLGQVLASVVPEIVSRLCCKCSPECLTSIGEFLVEIYNSDKKRKFRGIRNLTRRLVAAWPRQQYDQLIRLLMNTLLPIDLRQAEKTEFINPFQELLLAIRKNPCEAVSSVPETEYFEPNEEYWTCSVSDDPQRRRWAIMSLICLYQQNRLTRANIRRFSEALWSQRDKDGFPKYSEHKRFAFLRLPYPDQVDPLPLFRQFLRKNVFLNRGNTRELDDMLASCDEIAGASEYLVGREDGFENIWTEDDCDKIVYFLGVCWNIIKVKPLGYAHNGNAFWDSMVDENGTNLKMLVDGMARIMSRCRRNQFKTSSCVRIRQVIDEIAESGSAEFDFLALRLRASCLHLFPEFSATLFSQIRRTLISNDPAQIWNGLHAVIAVVRARKVHSVKEIERFVDVVSLPFEMIYWSPVGSVGLPRGLRCVFALLREDSGIMRGELEEKTLLALDRIAEQTFVSGNETRVEEKLEVRRDAARLAFHLASAHGSHEFRGSAVLQKWEMICRREEEFSEIRNMWCVFLEGRLE